jgi:alkylation response protein AidB-like acyl-CoA dehydrogenase
VAAEASSASLLGRVQTIRPIIQEHAANGEQERHLSKPTVEAMAKAGLFRVWLPKAFGGLEIDPVNAMRMIEEISRVDSAAGWNLQIAISVTIFLVWFPDDAVQEILTENREVIMGGTLFPPGHAVPVEGGYRLTGRWPFVSGCRDCSWFLGPSFVVDDRGSPKCGENGEPLQFLMIYRAKEAQLIDTWHTIGMRGTGSHDIAVQDLFVPHRRAVLLAPLQTRGKAFEGPLYRLTIWPAIAALAPPALGIARSAIDALCDLAKQKTPHYTRSTLRERPVVQMQVGEAEALLGAARAYLYESLADAWNTALEGQPLSLKQKIKIQLATSYAIRAAADAVDLVHRAAGTTAIRQNHPFERHFRDVHVITQHAFGSTSRYESVGKILFGLDSDWGFFPL